MLIVKRTIILLLFALPPKKASTRPTPDTVFDAHLVSFFSLIITGTLTGWGKIEGGGEEGVRSGGGGGVHTPQNTTFWTTFFV